MILIWAARCRGVNTGARDANMSSDRTSGSTEREKKKKQIWVSQAILMRSLG